jgi:hypothetical protein
MRRALLPAFLLLLGSVVLGATVLREPLARAAASIPPVLVSNDPSHALPVREQNLDGGSIRVHEEGTASVNVTNGTLPVHEQGTAKATSDDRTQRLVGETIPAGGSVTVDASAYREVRLVVRTINCPVGSHDDVTVWTEQTASQFIPLDELNLTCSFAATRTYDVPGTRLRIDTAAGSDTDVILLGRAN